MFLSVHQTKISFRKLISAFIPHLKKKYLNCNETTPLWNITHSSDSVSQDYLHFSFYLPIVQPKPPHPTTTTPIHVLDKKLRIAFIVPWKSRKKLSRPQKAHTHFDWIFGTKFWVYPEAEMAGVKFTLHVMAWWWLTVISRRDDSWTKLGKGLSAVGSFWYKNQC